MQPTRVERVRAGRRRLRARSANPLATQCCKARFRHVLLAPGHPGLALPAELAGDARVVHAYEPHGYARRVAVVGAGMAAATEWLNALAAGAEVTSVRRRDPLRRPLNLPRPLFSKRGLAGYHATAAPARAELLTELSAPSYPPGPGWDEPVEARRARGPLPRGRHARRRGPGDLRHRLPTRVRATIRCCAASSRSTGSRRRAVGSCSRLTRRFPGSPTAAGRSPSPASTDSGPTRQRTPWSG